MDRSKADIRRVLMRSKAPEFARLMILSMLEGAEDTFDAMSNVLKAELYAQARIGEDKFLQTFEELIGLLRRKIAGDTEITINCEVEDELTPTESPKSPVVSNNAPEAKADVPFNIRELSHKEAEEVSDHIEIVAPIITEPEEPESSEDTESSEEISAPVIEEEQQDEEQMVDEMKNLSVNTNGDTAHDDSTDDDFRSVKEEDYLTPAQGDEEFEYTNRYTQKPPVADAVHPAATTEKTAVPAPKSHIFDGIGNDRGVIGYIHEPGQRFPKKVFGRRTEEKLPAQQQKPIGRRSEEGPRPSGSGAHQGTSSSNSSSMSSQQAQPSSSKQARKGEEGETVWLETECTLHQFFNKSDVRKRGSGTLRVLEHMTTGVMRCVMYSQRDGSIFSNFVVTKQFECRTGAKSDCIVTWNCLDTQSLTPEIPGTFVCSFTTPDQAILFQKILKTYGPNAEDRK